MITPLFHVTANSNEVKEGSIFVAIKGSRFDGTTFISDALNKGARAIYSEVPYPDPRVIHTGNNTRKKLAELASESLGHPSHKLKMIGITGTSGKTTTSYLVQHLLNQANRPCARVGTNGFSFRTEEQDSVNTTPDPVTLQNYFSKVLNQGATHIVMEVSSHSLDQYRTWGTEWDAVAFLNLSPEHLDYHPSMDHYFQSKQKLFTEHLQPATQAGKKTVAIINIGNEWGQNLAESPNQKAAHLSLFSSQKNSRNIQDTQQGIKGEILLKNWTKFSCPMYGRFQIDNILAAVQLVQGLGMTDDEIITGLSSFAGVPGRMQSIPNSKGITVLVDYAHKPEALEKVLESIQRRPIHCVFGCGGDRDATKRPVMGDIAARLSDHLIVTSDNPRTEDPIKILTAIEVGVKKCMLEKRARIKNYTVEPDRAKAIRMAITNSKAGDVILIAGKGHENYQILGQTKIHFDDREEALKVLNENT